MTRGVSRSQETEESNRGEREANEINEVFVLDRSDKPLGPRRAELARTASRLASRLAGTPALLGFLGVGGHERAVGTDATAENRRRRQRPTRAGHEDARDSDDQRETDGEGSSDPE